MSHLELFKYFRRLRLKRAICYEKIQLDQASEAALLFSWPDLLHFVNFVVSIPVRTEYIGGDSRYWPPSSWIMHLVGPEGFDRRPDLCEQYQCPGIISWPWSDLVRLTDECS